MERINRRIDNPYFWIEYSKKNEVFLNCLNTVVVDGNNFTDSIFKTTGKKDILKIQFIINDYKSNPISYLKLFLLEFNDKLYSDIGNKELYYIIEDVLDKYVSVDIRLMAVFAEEDESEFMRLDNGQDILLLTTKFYDKEGTYCYLEECLRMELYDFYDMGR